MGPCVYCGCGKVTKEHIVNESLYHEFFGEPMSFVLQHSSLGEKLNRVDKINDVCAVCNNVRLQPYDNAGIILARSVKGISRGRERTIPFNLDIVGWLIKTHCNIIRKYGNTSKISSEIYECLRRHETVPREIYKLVLTVFSTDHKLFSTRQGDLPITWKIEPLEFSKPRIMRSYLRMEHFESFFYLPSDDDYHGFDERANTVLRKITPFSLRLSFFDTLPALRNGEIMICR